MEIEQIEIILQKWRGTENNPLNGKTFKEIQELLLKYGPSLEGYI